MFRREIANLKLSDQQREMLNLRLDLLDSFVVPPSRTAVSLRSRCGKGKLVIVDLSDPFLDAATACSLFRVGMGLFVEKGEDEAGKMILFDEAHKVRHSTEGLPAAQPEISYAVSHDRSCSKCLNF